MQRLRVCIIRTYVYQVSVCISLDLGISFSNGIYAGPIGLALCMRNY